MRSSAWPTFLGLGLVLTGLVGLDAATRVQYAPRGEPPLALSADGSTVVFRSSEPLVPEDRNRTGTDVYAKELATGRVTLVSAGSPRTEGYLYGVSPACKRLQKTVRISRWWWAPDVTCSWYSRLAVSGDGRYAAFATEEDDVLPGDTNGASDVFVRDRRTGALTRASTAADGSQAAGASGGTLALSGDGRKLAFLSTAADLVPGDTNGAVDAFVKDLVTGAVTRASTTADGGQLRAGADIGGLALSADGSTLAYATRSREVTGSRGGRPGAVQIVVKDLRTGAATWVSALPDGTPPRADSAGPSLSADGSVVAFVSRAELAGPLGRRRPAFDAYVRDLRTGEIVRASAVAGAGRAGGVAPGLSLSGDGSRVALTQVRGDRHASPDGTVLLDLRTGDVLPVSRDSAGRAAASHGHDVAVSADGDRVAFSGWRGRVKVLSTGLLVDVARPPRPSFWARFADAAIPDPVSLDPVRELFP